MCELKISGVGRAQADDGRRVAQSDVKATIKGRRSLSVCFMPFNEKNTYWRALATGLRAHGVSITSAWTLNELIGRFIRGHGVPEVVHIHFMPSFSRDVIGVRRMVTFSLFLIILRILGARFIWTVHDIYHPEACWLRGDRMMYRFTARLISKIVVHTDFAAQVVANEYRIGGRGRIAVVPHGNYIGAYPNHITRDSARSTLGLPADRVIFLFFGLIRPYKGVPQLIEAFQEADLRSGFLLVAGKPWRESDIVEVERSIVQRDRVRVDAGFIPDERVQLYLNACDAVVFPYRTILSSGAVVLAMSFQKACIAARVGCIPELIDTRGGVLYDPTAPGSLRGALTTAIEKRGELEEMGAYNYARAQGWAWEDAAATTVGIYDSALNGRQRKG